MKPIIGVVGHPYINIDDNLIYQATNSMVKKISKHGGLPIIICPTQTEKFLQKSIDEMKSLTFDEKEDLDDILSICDAIIKPGALRIYEYEKYIYKYALQKDIPYLGICAGMQLMGNSVEKNNNTCIEHCSKDKYVHSVNIMRNTLLYKILKQDQIIVNSLHNYHIKDIGINTVNAYSPDGIIEGIENSDKQFHLGLQWHPEGLDDEVTNKIFDSFIENASIYKKKIKRL